MSKAFDITAQVITNLLLFLLVMGLASTVEIKNMKTQLKNFKAIGLGLFCQFFLLPFLGWAVIEMFSLPLPVGITLLVVVSSPGGSYSNWWCSLLNADLALSVAMTTFSTILSVAFLPMNLLIYSHAAYRNSTSSDGQSILGSLNFGVIFISIAVVISAIAIGMFASAKLGNKIPWFHKFANIGANISGILLILFSVVLSFVPSSSGNDGTDPTEPADDSVVYIAIALPCLIGLVVSSVLATVAKLPRPERLTTAVECCYQNTGIATSAAISLFSGDDLQQASRVPFVYGMTEAISIGLFLIVGWKLGWSKAPRDEKCCKVITKSYEIESTSEEEDLFENEDNRPDSDNSEKDDEEAVECDEENGDKTSQEDDFQDDKGTQRTLRDTMSVSMSKSGSSDNFVENAVENA
mmetsp:Transcript_28160/g.81413  ORF Transcript_28160/g.81413 Transcript_28160/m.81413 type:complete len:409 (-) Transcript_28160:70-1296(-)